jgi:hypothetical protein
MIQIISRLLETGATFAALPLPLALDQDLRR